MKNVRTAYRATNGRLLISCATLALATAALTPQKAHAQSAPIGAFQGTISSSTNVSQNVTTPGVAETITVTNSSATIDWSATNNNFLPDGNTATFTSSSGITDYTVLNRITPVAGGQIQLNGNLISTLEGTSAKGGNIWFYSPSGIMVGSTAKFDVGGLLLTSISPTLDSNGPGAFGASFVPVDGDGGPIQILDGASIKALEQNSYVALVAPRVEQGGNVQVKGSAAYVAANEVTLTMDQGLFDIVVNVGTDDPNGIVHTGTTGGPASTNATTDPHRIYMVALPKNDALTMLLGGNLGFEPATVAGVENGQIVLGAGWYVTDINDSESRFWTPTELLDADVNAGITLGEGNYTSNVIGWTMGDLNVVADTGSINFAGFLNIGSDGGTSGNLILGASGTGNNLEIGGYFSFFSSDRVTGPADKSIFADSGATVKIHGNASLTGGNGEGSGADASIKADGGQIDIDGIATLNVDGFYWAAATSSAAAGDAIGGSVEITAYNNGVINTGGLSISADGTGQDSGDSYLGAGGNGTGGTIVIDADSSGTIGILGDLVAHADGYGGVGSDAGSGGVGQGGSAELSVGHGTITVGSAGLSADGVGGDGQTGGDGYGGTAAVYADDGTIDLGNNFWIRADGSGGWATFGVGGDGGDGTGGHAYIEARANPITEQLVPPAGLIKGGNGVVTSNGTGGVGGAGNADIAAGQGGNGYGGANCDCNNSGGASIGAQVGGGEIDFDNVVVRSTGEGGAGGTGANMNDGGAGGYGYGGDAFVGSFDWYGTQSTDGGLTFGDLDVLADGWGGTGGKGTDGGLGGNGRGGSATIDVFTGATLTAGNIRDLARGAGGDGGEGTTGIGGDGGDAFGGYYFLTVDGQLTATGFIGNANGLNGYVVDDETGEILYDPDTGRPLSLGGAGGIGATGEGAGGDAQSGWNVGAIINGTATITNNFVTTDYSQGGNGSVGGNASAGSSTLTINGSLSAGGTVQVSAQARGGDGFAGAGGSGTGGTSLLQNNATLDAGRIRVANSGTGGNGASGGGDGVGGSATFNTGGVATSHADADISLEALGVGGNASGAGGAGGYGQGGTIIASVDGGDVDAGTTFALNASAFGGDVAGADSTGGDVEGGSVSIAAVNGGSIDGGALLDVNTYGELGQGGEYGTYLGSGDVSISKDASSTIAATTVQVRTGIFDFAQTANFAATNFWLSVDGDYSASDYTIAGDLTISAGGSLTTGNLTAGGDVTLDAGGASTVNDVTAQNATFTAGGTANFNGTVSATDITVTSGDINVAEGAQLGVWGVTDDLTFNAVSNGNPILIGDLGDVSDEGSYHFNENGDIAGTTITFNAVGGNCDCSPDFVIGDVNIDGSGSETPAVSHVILNTEGSIFVDGIIDFHDAGATDSLTLNAGDSIQLNTDTGAISISDSSQAYTGTLNLTAHDVWVADSSILSQLNETGTIDANTLANNSGPIVTDGYLRAGGINVDLLGSSFLVQNSGTSSDFAGVTVGDGGLSITNQGEDPADVTIFGRQVQSNGTIVSGDQFAENSVETSGTFTTSSTVNGCPISGCGTTPPPPPPPPVVEPPPPPPPPVVEPPPPPPPPVVEPPPPPPPPVVEPPPPPPPPVVEPPPPPVIEPPLVDVPQQLGGAEGILGPVGEMNSPLDLASDGQSGDDSDDDSDDSGDDNQTNVDATLGLINTGPVNIDLPVDEPITSGGDGGFGSDGPGGL